MITGLGRDRRVVVGVDASHHATNAADWAAGEAAQRGVPLHIIHALDADPSSALAGPGAYSTHVHAVTQAGEQLLAEVKHRIASAHRPLEVTTELAHETAAGLRTLHAWAPYPGHAQDHPSDTDIPAREATERMAADLAAVREKFPDVHVTIRLERGHPAAVLTDASAHARLVVVGAHRHHGPLSLSIGPIIHGLLGHAYSPVAVVPVTKTA